MAKSKVKKTKVVKGPGEKEKNKILTNYFLKNIKDHSIEIDYGKIGDENFGVSVFWGDWKHDHSYVDNLAEIIGYTLITEDITEEDGSDCYSSTHYYVKDKLNTTHLKDTEKYLNELIKKNAPKTCLDITKKRVKELKTLYQKLGLSQ